MKLDFLDALSPSAAELDGRCGTHGTHGTANVHASSVVPEVLTLRGTKRDNSPAVDANTVVCPAMSRACPPQEGSSKASSYACVPCVPHCPGENESAIVLSNRHNGELLIQRWVLARCGADGGHGEAKHRSDATIASGAAGASRKPARINSSAKSWTNVSIATGTDGKGSASPWSSHQFK